jgi:tetratricopeptide (TPR) repeat protein
VVGVLHFQVVDPSGKSHNTDEKDYRDKAAEISRLRSLLLPDDTIREPDSSFRFRETAAWRGLDPSEKKEVVERVSSIVGRPPAGFTASLTAFLAVSTFAVAALSSFFAFVAGSAIGFGAVKVPSGPVPSPSSLRGWQSTAVRKLALTVGTIVLLSFGFVHTLTGHRLAQLDGKVFEEFTAPELSTLSTKLASESNRYQRPLSLDEQEMKMEIERLRWEKSRLEARLAILQRSSEWNEWQEAQERSHLAVALRGAQARIPSLRDGLAREPESLKLRFELANALRTVGDLPSAVVEYRGLLVKEPRNSKYLQNLAWTLCLLGRYTEALPHAQASIRLSPDDFDARDTLAHACYGVGLYGLAADTWSALLRIRPGYPKERDRLDCSLDQSHMSIAQTLSYMIDTLASFPSPFTPDAALISLYRLTVRRTYDVDLDRFAVAQKPEDSNLKNSLAWNLVLLGRYEEALAHAREAARLSPDDSDIQDTLAHAEYGTNHYSKAVAAWEAVLRKTPNYFSNAKHRYCTTDRTHVEVARQKAAEQDAPKKVTPDPARKGGPGVRPSS